jgi:hypothetical protein
MSITTRIVGTLDRVLPRLFEDENLKVDAIYKRLVERAFEVGAEYGTRDDEETPLSLVKVDERVSQSRMGQGTSGLRLKYYITPVTSLPAGFNADSVLEDKLEINGIDWTILSAELVLDRICIFEVTRQ